MQVHESKFLLLFVFSGRMSTPAQQWRGVTEGEQHEGHSKTLNDGDTSQKDDVSTVSKMSRSGKDSELQVDAEKTTGKGGKNESGEGEGG